MSQQHIVQEGAFDSTVRQQIEDNFTELYGTGAGGTLPSAQILVGNGSNEATAVDMSGDATIDNAGAVTVATVGGEEVALAVAAGYKVARGVHTQVAASDTVVTGLTTVVAVVASFQSAPTVKQLFVAADVGDQAGSPDAGSILIKSYKPTAVNDCTPTAATDFTDDIVFGWVAVGT